MSQLLTVEATAEILALHTRTVRRYIKENKLKAQKVGGQWRISSDDLKVFMGIDSFQEIANKPVIDPDIKFYNNDAKIKILISSVVDIFVSSKEEAHRLSSTIMAAMNGRDTTETARCDYLFYEEEGKARFMLWGSPSFMSAMMAIFETITDKE